MEPLRYSARDRARRTRSARMPPERGNAKSALGHPGHGKRFRNRYPGSTPARSSPEPSSCQSRYQPSKMPLCISLNVTLPDRCRSGRVRDVRRVDATGPVYASKDR